MKNSESKMEAKAEEFIAAAQDLHASGESGLYVREVGEQMARNDETFMRRHNAAKKILGCVGVDIGGPNKHFGALYPVVARLERQGKLESLWQEQSPADVGKPRRRVYRLIEKPEEI